MFLRPLIESEYHQSGHLTKASSERVDVVRRAKGLLALRQDHTFTNALVHSWLQEQLGKLLAEIEKKQPSESLPPEARRPLFAQWQTWLWPHECAENLPPLRISLVRDNLADHLTPDLVIWLFHHGLMSFYTLLSSSWLNMAESMQRIIMHRALASHISGLLSQSLNGLNQHPTPYVWKDKRYQRRKRVHLRRLGGSGDLLVA